MIKGERHERSYWESNWGDCYLEKIETYHSLLESAGFKVLKYEDVTQLAHKEIINFLNKLIKQRDKAIEAAGKEVYYLFLESWAEFAADYDLGKAGHCYFIAQKQT